MKFSLFLLGLLLLAAPFAAAQDFDDDDVIIEDLESDFAPEEPEETEPTIPTMEEEDDDFVALPPHPLTDMPEPAPGMRVKCVFPEKDERGFPIGERLFALVGLVNEEDEPFNVSMVMGSLNSPFQSSFYVQNFTERVINEELPAKFEVTHAYYFMVRPDLDPMDLTMALTVFYEDGENTYSTTFYNETVPFYEPGEPMDVKRVILYLLITVIVGGVGVGVWSMKKKSAEATIEVGTVEIPRSTDVVQDYTRRMQASATGKGSPKKRANLKKK